MENGIEKKKCHFKNTKQYFLVLNNKGSATVELAFLFPILLMILLLIIYLSLFLYNKVAAVAIAGESAIKGARQQAISKGQRENIALEVADEELSNRLVMHPLYERDAEVSATKVSVDISFEQEFPFSIWLAREGLQSNYFKYQTKQTAPRIHAARYIWKIRGLKKIKHQNTDN